MKLYRQSGYLLPNLSRGAPVSLSCTAPQTQLWFPHIPRLENLLMDHWCTEKTELANTGQKQRNQNGPSAPSSSRISSWNRMMTPQSHYDGQFGMNSSISATKCAIDPYGFASKLCIHTSNADLTSANTKNSILHPAWNGGLSCVCASSFGKFVGENLHKRWRFPNFETTPQLKLRHSAKIYPQRKQTENIGLPSRNQHDQLHDLLNISLKSRWFSHEHLHFGMSGRYDPRALGNAAGYPMFIRWISMVLMNSQLLLNMVNKSNFCLLKPRDFLGKVPLCHLLSMFICWNHSWTALFCFILVKSTLFIRSFFVALKLIDGMGDVRQLIWKLRAWENGWWIADVLNNMRIMMKK